MGFADVLFRVLVVIACCGLLFVVCLIGQRLSERPRGGLVVERDRRTAQRRRGAARWALLVLTAAAPFAAPLFVWPDVSVVVSATLVGCSLVAPLVVLSRLAGSRPAVAAGAWLACAAVLAATLWLLGGSVIATRAVPDRLEQEATLVAMRELGEAFERWRRDRAQALAPVAGHEGGVANGLRSADPVDDAGAMQPEPGGAGPGADVVRVDELPPLPLETLEQYLVPRYLRSLPRLDGWGRPLELRGTLETSPHLAIRSAGRDGEISSGSYRAGTFDPSSYDEDVVWLDGIFIRQPLS